mgnify:FL=1
MAEKEKQVSLKEDEVIIKLYRYEELTMLYNHNKILEAKIEELSEQIRMLKDALSGRQRNRKYTACEKS